MKRCCRCGVEKPFEDFHNDRYHRDGKSSKCKPCACASAQAWQAANAQRAAKRGVEYRVTHAKQIRAAKTAVFLSDPEGNRAKHAKQQRDLNARNPEPKRARQRRYYEAHVDQVRAKSARYNREHPEVNATAYARRRARKAGVLGSHTEAEWVACQKLHGNRCAHCGARDRKLTKDHIVPIKHGGSDFILNIQPLCAPCNRKKWHLIPDDFREFSLFDRIEPGGITTIR